MRTSITPAATAALALSFLSTVAAKPEGNTVEFKFEKRYLGQAEASGPRRFMKRQTVNAAITNAQYSYLVNVTVGTPPQSLPLLLDTGSSDLWIPSANSEFCQSQYSSYCQGTTYDASASSTYQQLDLPQFSIQYVDGTQIEGDYFTDTLTLVDATVTNLTMAVASQFDPIGQMVNGIMGVAFEADESSEDGGSGGFSNPTIVQQLKDQGKIDSLSYSLWLDDLEANTGSILFGGVDKDKYTGSLGSLPIQKDSTSNAYTSFTVAWTGLTITGSGNNIDMSPSSAQPVILDSGTSLTYLPDTIANSIFDGLGVVSYESGQLNVLPCSIGQNDLTLTFTFGGSDGIPINVSLAELVIPLELQDGSSLTVDGEKICQFGISPAGSNPLLFGDTFLRSAYVVYDLENLQIGLAQTNFNGQSGAGNVEAISSGIPDVTKTADAASVENTYTGKPLGAGGITQSGQLGGASATRSASFKLTPTSDSGSSGSGSGSNGKNAAGRPTADSSALAILVVTVAAFAFGAMLI